MHIQYAHALRSLEVLIYASEIGKVNPLEVEAEVWTTDGFRVRLPGDIGLHRYLGKQSRQCACHLLFYLSLIKESGLPEAPKLV